jgi:ABC-type lipoprotein export system ATPase subunit
VVMVTHDLGVAATTARQVSMRDGRIVADETRQLVPTSPSGRERET